MLTIEGPGASAGINAKSPAYNAKGDGVTDDRAALQAAVNDASSAHTSVYLPAGIYLVSAPITIPAGEGLTILGSGMGSRIKLMPNKNCFIFQMTGADTRITMRDLTIDGNCAQQGSLGSSGGINAIGAVSCMFDNIHFTGCRDDALYLGGMTGGAFGASNKVMGCLFDQSMSALGPGRGISLSSNNDNRIIGCDFEYLGGSGGTTFSTAVGILDLAGSQLILGCSFIGGVTNATKGVRIQAVSNTTVSNCTFDTVGGDNIFVTGTNHTIVDNTAVNVGATGTAGTVSGIHLESGAVNVTVQGNTLVSAAANGAARSLIREENVGGSGTNNIQGNTLVTVGTLSVSAMDLNAPNTLSRGNVGGGTTGDPVDSRYLPLTGGTLTGALSGTTFTGSGTSQVSNLRLGTTGTFGGATGSVIAFTNVTTPPNANPSGAILYAEGGVVKVRQSNGANIILRNTVPVIATALQSNSTVTQTASTYLTVAVEASATYQMRAFLVIQSPSGVSFTHSFTGPAGATMVWGDATATSIATLTGVDSWTGSGANKTALLSGQLTTSSTAGNLVLTFASGTAGQAAVLGAGSWLEVVRVS
jgi:hypothetical protein